MDSEERVLSILSGKEGWNHEYSSISEFKHHLNEPHLIEAESERGWVLYERQLDPHPLIPLLNHIASHSFLMRHCIVHFWALVRTEGRRHFLSASLFCVGKLNRGVCWYRRLCVGHLYAVDVEGDEVVDVGSVGRAYRSRYPESTPDLRLYSAQQYPMRDGAARCGFTGYMALPVFDVDMSSCYGVLELLFHRLVKPTHLVPTLDRALQISGLRSTHNSLSMQVFTEEMHHAESEIGEVLELAAATVPRLYLTQVWVLCKQCGTSHGNTSTNSRRCMERSSFLINSGNTTINTWGLDIDLDMYTYLKACELHPLQIDLTAATDSYLSDPKISKNPLAHYALRARVFHSFAISLQIDSSSSSSNNNNSSNLYVLEFFLRPQRRQDAHGGDYSLQLLLRIMEMNFQSFKFVSRGNFLEECRQNPNTIPHESIDSSKAMKSYKRNFSKQNFIEYIEIKSDAVSCCLHPSSIGKGWVFYGDNNINGGSSAPGPTSIGERIEDFMKKIAAQPRVHSTWIAQFWAPKVVEDRFCLQTLGQPYSLGCLSKGLASFRKKCMKQCYFVGDEAKDDELGPPGRVFRNGHPELSPDLFLYTAVEFPVRNHAMHCFGRGYFALPVYLLGDEHEQECVGVLEFVGFIFSNLYGIGKTLKEAELCSSHIDFVPRFSFEKQVVDSNNTKEISNEMSRALKQIYNGIPQIHMAKVWVPYGECASSTNSSCCMELASSSNDLDSFMPTDEVHWIHVRPGKGIVGMLMASGNNACFCRNLCEFSIADQPLSHYEVSQRCEACFTVCLQSSHTGDLVYVMEFFIVRGSTYEYLRSFLNFLLPTMKRELKSFKTAFGKQLGEELVVDVVEFCDADRLLGSPEETGEADSFPVKFKSVQYGKHAQEHGESKKREKGKRRSRFSLSLEVLKQNFGKKLKVVAQELGIGRSTIKRACREHGIDRWPSKAPSSLFERGSSGENLQQERSPEISSPRHVITHEEGEKKVIVKVKHEEDIIKFELDLGLSLGLVDKVFEQVAAKLNLEPGTFKLKYLDEDCDEILLTCDDDLRLCPKTRTATGKTGIQLLVRLIS